MDENKSTGMEECEIRHKHRSAKEEKDLISRLNRIEGQVRGVKAMVQDERYCTDILVQVSAIQSALNGFSRTLLSSHVKSCVVEEIKNGDADKAVDELCETLAAHHVDRVKNKKCTPKNGMLYLDMLNNLERIADHANNLAESVDHKGDPDRLLW